MAFFISDNTSGISPEIPTALAAASEGHAPSYGSDPWSERLTARFREVFNHPTLLAFPVFNGSAANCVGLASLMRPFEAVIAHTHAHIEQDECGMPEFFTGGKIITVAGEGGKLTPAGVEAAVTQALSHGVHHPRPRVLSLTQATECGTLYRPEEIRALAEVATRHQLHLQMDGARFANAVASLGCTPAAISWKAGVDVLSFGGTKNGAMLAEAVIFFRPELAADMGYIRKRAGQLASKQRFIAVQLLALLENDLWLRNARHANVMAKRLAVGLSPQMELLFPVETNSLFVRMPEVLAQSLWDKGHGFYDWKTLGADVYRLVTGFSTTEAEVDGFSRDMQGA
jgi:threonine aldolase